MGTTQEREVNRLRMDEYVIRTLIGPAEAQGATDDYIAAMLTLRAGDVPDMDALRNLGPALNEKYGASPAADGSYSRRYTLLDHALIFANLEGVEALLAAGADPNFSGFQFANAALPGHGGAPDWSISVQFLQPYLDLGGRDDYAMPNDPYPMVSLAFSAGNYDGAKVLLAAGADPWMPIRGLTPDRPPSGRDLYPILKVSGARAESLTFLIWFQESGHLDTAPSALVAQFYDGFLKSVPGIVSGQIAVELPEIRLWRDLFLRSLEVNSSYRAQDRVSAANALRDFATR